MSQRVSGCLIIGALLGYNVNNFRWREPALFVMDAEMGRCSKRTQFSGSALPSEDPIITFFMASLDVLAEQCGLHSLRFYAAHSDASVREWAASVASALALDATGAALLPPESEAWTSVRALASAEAHGVMEESAWLLTALAHNRSTSPPLLRKRTLCSRPLL